MHVHGAGLASVEVEAEYLGERLHERPGFGALCWFADQPDVVVEAVQEDAGLAIDGKIHKEEDQFADQLLGCVSHGDTPLADPWAELGSVVGGKV